MTGPVERRFAKAFLAVWLRNQDKPEGVTDEQYAMIRFYESALSRKLLAEVHMTSEEAEEFVAEHRGK